MAKSKIHSSAAARRQQSSTVKVLAYVFGSVMFLGIAYINIQSESQISKSSESPRDIGQNSLRTEDASGVPKGGDTAILVELQNMRESKPRNDSRLDPVLSYRVIEELPHDRDAFTQGLEYLPDGRFIEGTGINSRLREVEIATGRVLREARLEERHFGEGTTVMRGKVFQITWQTRTAFVYNLTTFKVVTTLGYDTEGWGLTHDDEHLIMSDGSHRLFFRDPETFDVVRIVEVKDELGKPVPYLNELELVRGEVLANVWHSDRVARIDPRTGALRGWIDFAGILPARRAETRGEDVLNGIAYDAARDRLWVTGKLWPRLFRVALTRKRPGRRA